MNNGPSYEKTWKNERQQERRENLQMQVEACRKCGVRLIVQAMAASVSLIRRRVVPLSNMRIAGGKGRQWIKIWLRLESYCFFGGSCGAGGPRLGETKVFSL